MALSGQHVNLATLALLTVFLLAMCGDVESNPGPPTSDLKCLSAIHCNINSLYAHNSDHKLGELESLVDATKTDIIALTETWLDSTIPNQMLSIGGFLPPIRKDRNRHGGGVLIYCADHLPVIPRLDLSQPDQESLWIEIKPKQNEKLLIGVYYRPPNQTAADRDLFLLNLNQTLLTVFEENPKTVLIMGDFNDRCVLWDDNHSSSELGNKLYDLVTGNGLTQLIDSPTHLDNTGRPQHLLDLVMTDSPELILDSHILAPIDKCHHCPTFCKLAVRLPKDKPYKRTVWDLKNIDIAGLSLALTSAPWNVAYDIYDDIDDIEHYWTSLFIDTAKQFIPMRIITVRPRNKPWITKTLNILIRKKNRLWRRFKKTQKPEHLNIYRNVRNQTVREITKAKNRYYNSIIPTLQNPDLNPKKWWSLTKSLLNNKTQTAIPPLFEQSSVVTDAAQKAEIFNVFFAQNSRLPPHAANHPLPAFEYLTNQRLDNLSITSDEVNKVLASLNVSKATGPDTIGNFLLKICARAIAEPLTRLFNYSLQTHKFPSTWKFSNVVPIHKKNSRNDKANYRPISLLCNTSKVMERLIHNKIYSYLITNSLLTPLNSGFKKHDSAVNQLIVLYDNICKSLEQKHDVRLVFLDLSKAFDRVWHKGLLFKLKQLGITGPPLLWIEDYLKDRHQRVVIDGQSSDWIKIEAGVPQGSILGPLLFVVFINDIVKEIQANIKLFADDTSLFHSIIDSHITQALLNRDLQKISEWAAQWLMIFNVLKNESMTLSLRNNPPLQPPLYFNGTPLKEVTQHTHLGITFSSKMSWKPHVDRVCFRAGQRNNILRKLKFRLPRKTLQTLYKSLVRPILEYGDVVFDDSSITLSQKMEAIQYDAARTCTGAFLSTNRNSILLELGWNSLADRRKNHKLILYYKMVNGLTPSYLKDLLPTRVADVSRYSLRNAGNRSIVPTRTTRYKTSFLPSTTALWNNLTDQIRHSTSLLAFKYNLNNSTKLPTPPQWFLTGSRYANILHTRIRLKNPMLNCYSFRVGRSPVCSCECGCRSETIQHYFLECPRYAVHRRRLLADVRNLIAPGIHPHMLIDLDTNHLLNIFTNGSEDLDSATNISIFNAVQYYLISSGRFSS